MQVSLLRFLDRGEYRPVGSTRTLQADVRIVGATNQDIQSMVMQGRFREDLYYRLNTVTLRVPPLRERRDDIAVLAEHVLHSLGQPTSRGALSPDAIAALQHYGWPGNIRELRNVLERLVMMGQGKGPISGEDVERVLPAETHNLRTSALTRASLDEVERAHIQRVLDACDGNKTQAAKILRIDYKTLLTRLKK
jgi:transcriptional regulator with PAS, ATPase and Fis domain